MFSRSHIQHKKFSGSPEMKISGRKKKIAHGYAITNITKIDGC